MSYQINGTTVDRLADAVDMLAGDLGAGKVEATWFFQWYADLMRPEVAEAVWYARWYADLTQPEEA